MKRRLAHCLRNVANHLDPPLTWNYDITGSFTHFTTIYVDQYGKPSATGTATGTAIVQ